MLLIGVVFLGVQTPSGQEFLTGQAQRYLRKKLQTRVEIEKIRFRLPEWVSLEGVYVEDPKGDTLVAGKRLYARMDMWGLLKGRIAIQKVEAENIRAKVYRTDSVFNYQFVIDAFASDTPEEESSGSALNMSWDSLAVRGIRLSYLDEMEGMDTEVSLPEGLILFAGFNPSYSRYHPTTIHLRQPDIRLRMFQGTAAPAPVTAAAAPGDTLDLKLGQLEVTDFRLRYTDEVSGLLNGVEIGKLAGIVDKIYLQGQQAEIRELTVQKLDTYVEFEKRAVAAASEEPPAISEGPGWTVKAGKVTLEDNHLRYDDFNAPALQKGMDFSHIHLRQVTASLSDLLYSPDSTAGKLEHLSAVDKSGFQLDQFSGNFTYSGTETSLKNGLVKTPATTLNSEVVLNYRNREQLTEDLGSAAVAFRLENSRFGFRDVLLLAPDLASTPPFEKQPNGYIAGSAVLTGTVGDLKLQQAMLTMPEAIRMAVSGTVKGLPEVEKMQLELQIAEISANRADLLALLPENTLPESVALPDSLKLTGTLDGSLADMKVDARLETTFGSANLVGNFVEIADSLNAGYNGSLALEEFDLGKLLKQPPETLGKVSLTTDFSGKGWVPTEMEARLTGTIASASVNGYTYQNLVLSGAMDKGQAQMKATSDDPNATLTLEGSADMTKDYPSVLAKASIGELDLKALNLYPDPIRIRGELEADLSDTNPDNPLGTVKGTGIVLNNDGTDIPVGHLEVSLSNTNGIKEMRLDAGFAKAELKGTFDYTQLGAIIEGEMNKYFVVSDTLVPAVVTPYEIAVTAKLAHHAAIQAFEPGLTRLDTVQLTGQLTNQQDTTLRLMLSLPEAIYDTTRITGAGFEITGDGKRAGYEGTIDEVLSSGFRVRNLTLSGEVADNRVLLGAVVKDSVGRDQHAFVSRLRKEGATYAFNLQNRLLLNYRPWRTDSTGYIAYGPEGVLVHNFSLRRNRSDERLEIHSVGDREGEQPYPNGPIRIIADSVAVGPLVTLVTRDSTLAAGRLDGNILLKDYMGDAPGFSGDLKILGMHVTQIALGDFALKATNDQPGRIRMDMSLKGENNDVTIQGNYLTADAQPLDFILDLKRMEAKTIEAFSFGELRNASGRLTGRTTIKGSPENPLLNGTLNFEEVAFNVKQLGARYAIEDGNISFENEKMRFRNFALIDSLQQKLQINGLVTLTNLPNVTYDLGIVTDNFMALNASRKDNELVYGKGFIKADIAVKGMGSESIIDGSVKILKDSDITLILPDNAGAISRGDGIVEFVDHDKTVAETDAGTGDLGVVVGFASELSLNIETDKEAQFTVVIDELNGDNLKVKGNALLNTGLAPNGQLYLQGLYELEEGSYELSFEILRKQFDIRKGSQLIWSGDPMKAELDITAVYQVQADPSAFSPSNFQYGKVPFEVLLTITGNLSNPRVQFGLEVSDRADNSIRDKIDKELILKPMQDDPAEMNKQVFALLLMNKFMSETSNVSFGGFSAEAIARQSVSKLLSDQLNNLASDLVKGVQLDFNLNSTTGATGGRTDLNVGLTKGFMNDRVTVSVGRNFELENSAGAVQSSEIFDNIALNYKITRDGRYLVRAYRKNQFQTVLEGFIVETGVSFIVTLDYDLVKEFFR